MGFGPTGAVLPATSISRSTGRGQRNKHTVTNVYRASRDLFLAQRATADSSVAGATSGRLPRRRHGDAFDEQPQGERHLECEHW